MKTTETILIFAFCLVISNTITRSQDNNAFTTEITHFVDSLDQILGSSSNLPGDYLCNSVTSYRNVRAIGMQETKINYYFMQKDDSVVETSGSVEFIPRYSPAVKINIAYNIAAASKVNVAYYFFNKSIFCRKIYDGDYGYEESRIWINEGELIRIEYFTSPLNKAAYVKTKEFMNRDLTFASEVVKNSAEYEKLFNNIFKTEQLDK